MPAERGTRWGWHELDSRWARRLVAAAGIEPGDPVLDIGAGTGAITEELLRAGASVVAFELNPGRAAVLRDRFRGCDIKVVQADASDLRLPRRPFKVVANPPFAITTSVVKRLVAPGSELQRAALVVPSYAAMRWSDPAAPGSTRWRRDFTLHLGRSPPRSAFRPPPPRNVSVLVIESRHAAARGVGGGSSHSAASFGQESRRKFAGAVDLGRRRS